MEHKSFADNQPKKRERESERKRNEYLFLFFSLTFFTQKHSQWLRPIQPSGNLKPVAVSHLTANSDYLHGSGYFLVVLQIQVSMFSSRNVFAGDGPLPTDCSSPSIHSSELKMLSVAVVSFAKPV